MERVSRGKRREHEKLLARRAEDEATARELSERYEAEKVEDEQKLREAVAAGRKAPKAKAPATEEALAEARTRLEVAEALVAESGKALVADLTDADLEAALADLDKSSREVIAKLPPRAAALVADMRRCGEMTHEALWIGILQERRVHAPYRPSVAAATSQLRQAEQALMMAQEMIAAHHEEQAWRDAGPPQHHPPSRGYAPPAGSEITASRITTGELPRVTPSASVPVPRDSSSDEQS
jgi:hypothetical protein